MKLNLTVIFNFGLLEVDNDKPGETEDPDGSNPTE